MGVSFFFFENLFVQDLFYDTVQIYWICLRKADFIMTTVVQVADVARGLLVDNYIKNVWSFIFLWYICTPTCSSTIK